MAKNNKKRTAPASKASKKKNAAKQSNHSAVWWLFRWLLTLGLWAGIAIGGLLAWYAYQLPDFRTIGELSKRPSVTLVAASGEVFATYGDLYGQPVTLEDLPPHLIHAILATEDRRFYSHFGIDLIGISRAMMRNIRAGGVVEGGSTITQQLAKNLFLTHQRTFRRKIQEVVIALWLEHNFTKDQILTLYLNRVYFGAGTYGLEAASQRYFNKSASALNVQESAVLTGLLKAPSRLNPLLNKDMALERGYQVLENMVNAGYLQPEDVTRAKSRPLLLPHATGTSSTRFFADWVLDEINKRIGFFEDDIIVQTTLDIGLQRHAEQTLISTIDENGLEYNIAQGALVSLDETGAVHAMAGGYQYHFSQFNRVTQALRQSGSAFKLIVALAALEAGYTPSSTLTDAPINLRGWSPENFTGRYRGTVTLQETIIESLNVPIVYLAQQIGISAILQTARKLGIESSIRRDFSSALGTSETTVLEITAAYAAVANGGYLVKPYSVTRIQDKYGKLLYVRRPTQMPRVISSESVTHMQQMLTQAIQHPQGTATRARLSLPNLNIGGKTGTSQQFRDAWFVGYAGQLTTGVWLGNDDNTPMNKVTGGLFPAVIWKNFMAEAAPKRGNTPPASMLPAANENAAPAEEVSPLY